LNGESNVTYCPCLVVVFLPRKGEQGLPAASAGIERGKGREAYAASRAAS